MNLYPASLHCWYNYLSTLSVSPALRITCIRQARFCTAPSPILHSLDHRSKKFGSLSWCVLRHAEAFCHIRCYVSPTDTHPRVRAANFTRPSSVKKALCFICIKQERCAVGVINYKTAWILISEPQGFFCHFFGVLPKRDTRFLSNLNLINGTYI